MIIFAPAGKPDSFGNRKFPEDLPEYLASFGLNGFELSCGRGLNISEKTYEILPALAREHGIYLSLHAPYFISLSGEKPEIRQKSAEYILQSAKAASRLGAERVVVHSGSCAKMSRETALGLAKETLSMALEKIRQANLAVKICPETMGKINQLGTLEEVIELCKLDESCVPCIDFGHLNARTHGGIKTKQDYAAIFDTIEDKLGIERAKNLHIHFSKIEYTAGGEKKHLTFEDTDFGPDYEPLLEVVAERAYAPAIICESQGTQAEDAAIMRNYFERTGANRGK
ncbi:MAG: TIM barrel protein [Oscillospiraceae bacterium]|nr:TIM barrel protein [Oscillospiraceae bacterium]